MSLLGPLGGAVNAMRERGFLDASAGKPASELVVAGDPKVAAAYMAGYRLGVREKAREPQRSA